MMLHTRKVYGGIFSKKTEPEKRFTKDLPDWPGFDRWAVTKTSKLAWCGVYILIYAIFAPSAWYFLLLPIEMLTVPFHGAIVNWYAHKYGYKNFTLKNTSTNLLPVDLLLMGEAYHNDHHKHASAINFGVKWYELDFTYYIILLFGKIGIIQLKSDKSKYGSSEETDHIEAVTNLNHAQAIKNEVLAETSL
jgi:stearoyl-CoA desaturase (delta-9 desaturase)